MHLHLSNRTDLRPEAPLLLQSLAGAQPRQHTNTSPPAPPTHSSTTPFPSLASPVSAPASFPTSKILRWPSSATLQPPSSTPAQHPLVSRTPLSNRVPLPCSLAEQQTSRPAPPVGSHGASPRPPVSLCDSPISSSTPPTGLRDAPRLSGLLRLTVYSSVEPPALSVRSTIVGDQRELSLPSHESPLLLLCLFTEGYSCVCLLSCCVNLSGVCMH